MSSFLGSLNDTVDRYDTYIVDLWGVTHNGFELFPQVRQTFQSLKSQGKDILFLSNAPRRKHPIIQELTGMGLDPSLYTDLYTSGEDAHQTLKAQHRGKVCFSLVAQDGDLLRDTGAELTDDLTKADYFLNTKMQILPRSDSQPLLEKARDLGLPMICVNPDLSVISGKKIKLCAGSLAEHYKEIGGTVTYHGKPYPGIYENLWASHDRFDKSRTVALGDALHTDILGAKTFGVDSILILSGLEGRALGLSLEVFSDLEPLKQHCNRKGIHPTYFLPQVM